VIRSTRDPANVLTTPVTVRVASVADERGLVYAATAALRPSSGGSATDEAPLGPMELDVRVTITNTAAESRGLWLSACAAWIRIYRSTSPPQSIACAICTRCRRRTSVVGTAMASPRPARVRGPRAWRGVAPDEYAG
jgi:hypothetical protein